MGMFDYVSNRLFCPYCGAKQPRCSFQTKSLRCFMDTLTLKKKTSHVWLDEETVELHCPCDFCKAWISLRVSKNDIKTRKVL